MNLKLFKKIIKNLLKFVHIALSKLVINAKKITMARGYRTNQALYNKEGRYQKALLSPYFIAIPPRIHQRCRIYT